MNPPFERTLDDFHPGQIFHHQPGKTITESDNNLFCLLTGNWNPLHLDQEYAAASLHGKIVVAGTYTFSLAVGMSVADLSGRAIATVEYDSIVHHAPVFIGDTIHTLSEVLEVIPSRRKPDRGILVVRSTTTNQSGVTVLSFIRKILLPRSTMESD